MSPRTIAIGDIHGCSAALAALLVAIRPRPEDVIITLGDYINRGPDSRGVLDRLVDLGRRLRLVALLGNHDQMLLDVRSGKSPDLLAARHRRHDDPGLLRPRARPGPHPR
jgi:serine/threonine protein phosphatase 1